MNESKSFGFQTNSIHAGEKRPGLEGAVGMPIFQNSTYEVSGAKSYDSVRYTRLSNTPNHLALAEKLSALERCEEALVTASGMAAITTALLALVPKGGHLVAQSALYGGTHAFLTEDFETLGRTYSTFDIDDLAGLERELTRKPTVLYVEAISNPLMKIPDLAKIVELGKKAGALLVIDNTFCSPYLFNPSQLGFDLVLHSATKYLNGHSDVIAGVVAGKKALVDKTRLLLNHLGGSLDSHSCFLLNRGIKTLAARMKMHEENAMALAEALTASPKCKNVRYPGLTSHPHHQRAREYFRGFGGMIAFEYAGTAQETDQFLSRLRIPFVAPSLGSVESLVTRPVTTSHSAIAPADRVKLGVLDNLVRVSVGLEDKNDLIADFLQAL